MITSPDGQHIENRVKHDLEESFQLERQGDGVRSFDDIERPRDHHGVLHILFFLNHVSPVPVDVSGDLKFTMVDKMRSNAVHSHALGDAFRQYSEHPRFRRSTNAEFYVAASKAKGIPYSIVVQGDVGIEESFRLEYIQIRICFVVTRA